METAKLRGLGRLQIFVGVAATMACIVALFVTETSINATLLGFAGVSRDLGRETEQTRQILIEQQHALETLEMSLDTYSQVAKTLKQSSRDIEALTPGWEKTSHDTQDLMGKVEQISRGVGGWMRGASIPDGIADWGVAPPRLHLSYAHPLAVWGTSTTDLADQVHIYKEIVKNNTDTVIKIVREGNQSIGTSCDATVALCCVSIEMTPRCLNRSVTPW